MVAIRVYRCAAICLASVLCLASVVFGDVLHLKGGQKAEGNFISNDGTTIVFEMNGQTLRLPVARVERVEKAGGGDPLAQVRRHVEAERWQRAFRACRHVLEGDSSAARTREAAECEMERILDRAAATFRKRMADMDCERAYLKCIEHARQQRLVGDPAGFDAQVWRRVECRLRVEAAGRMIGDDKLVEAREQLEAVSQAGDSFLGYHREAGRLAYRTADYEDAAGHLDKAARRDREDRVVHGELILALGLLDRPEKIVETWDACKAHFDRQRDFDAQVCEAAGTGFARCAFAKADSGDVVEAKRLFAKSLGLRDSTVSLFQEAAEFYSRIGDVQSAAKMRQRAEAQQAANRRRLQSMQEARAQRAADAARMRARAQENLDRQRQQEEYTRSIQRSRSSVRRSSSG